MKRSIHCCVVLVGLQLMQPCLSRSNCPLPFSHPLTENSPLQDYNNTILSYQKPSIPLNCWQLFSVLEREQPKYRHKVTGISCDIAAPALALSEHDRQLLAQEVTVVFHGAATVRFDEKLRIAYYINIRGTEEMLSLAKEMKNLKVCLKFGPRLAILGSYEKRARSQYHWVAKSCESLETSARNQDCFTFDYVMNSIHSQRFYSTSHFPT